MCSSRAPSAAMRSRCGVGIASGARAATSFSNASAIAPASLPTTAPTDTVRLSLADQAKLGPFGGGIWNAKGVDGKRGYAHDNVGAPNAMIAIAIHYTPSSVPIPGACDRSQFFAKLLHCARAWVALTSPEEEKRVFIPLHV